MTTSHNLSLGVALLSAGVAGIVARYWFFGLHLDVSPVTRGLLIGTLSTFVVIGFQTIRRALAEGSKVSPPVVAVGLMAAAAVAALAADEG